MGLEMEVEVETESPDDDATASKACADCHTTKTPLWRGGPEGPKSLCNACGIRYRKRRRQALSLDARQHADPQEDRQPAADSDPQEEDRQPAADSDPQPKRKPAAAASSSSTSKNKEEEEEDQQLRPKKKKKKPARSTATNRSNKDRQVTVELRVVGFGKEVMLKQRRQMRRSKCMSEEERAAVLLMAMSSGVIYAS